MSDVGRADAAVDEPGAVVEEQVGPPARALRRLSEHRPDGRRLTRYMGAGAGDGTGGAGGT